LFGDSLFGFGSPSLISGIAPLYKRFDLLSTSQYLFFRLRVGVCWDCACVWRGCGEREEEFENTTPNLPAPGEDLTSIIR